MAFDSINQAQYDVVRTTTSSLRKAAEYTRELRDMLADLFANEHAKDQWGVTFELNPHDTGAVIDTPYGAARAAPVNSVVNGKVQIRYVIEKVVATVEGASGYLCVWEVLVDEAGIVTSSDGETIFARLNTFEHTENRRGVGIIGLSLLYAIGAERSRQ